MTISLKDGALIDIASNYINHPKIYIKAYKLLTKNGRKALKQYLIDKKLSRK